jgi:hypothetical protein
MGISEQSFARLRRRLRISPMSSSLWTESTLDSYSSRRQRSSLPVSTSPFNQAEGLRDVLCGFPECLGDPNEGLEAIIEADIAVPNSTPSFRDTANTQTPASLRSNRLLSAIPCQKCRSHLSSF